MTLNPFYFVRTNRCLRKTGWRQRIQNDAIRRLYAAMQGQRIEQTEENEIMLFDLSLIGK